MLKVIAHHYVRPEELPSVRPLLEELVEKSRTEARCIAYDLFIDQEDPGHLVFIEAWEDQSALEEHFTTEHFVRIVPQLKEYQRQEGGLLRLSAF